MACRRRHDTRAAAPTSAPERRLALMLIPLALWQGSQCVQPLLIEATRFESTGSKSSVSLCAQAKQLKSGALPCCLNAARDLAGVQQILEPAYLLLTPIQALHSRHAAQ